MSDVTRALPGVPPGDVGERDAGVIVLRHRAGEVPLARRALVRELQRRCAPERAVDEVAVVVSELLGNAVRYAAPTPSGELQLRWRLREDAVEVAVVDGGGGRPRRSPVSEDATTGRGLHLVAALSEAWGTAEAGPGQRAVWASVPARERTAV